MRTEFRSLTISRKKNNQQRILHGIISAFEGRNCQKTATHEEEKILFHQDNALGHKSIVTMAKSHELGFELLPHPPYSPNLAPSDYYLFADLKKMLAGKKFNTNEEVIAETEANFEAKDKSFYKEGVETLERRWTGCITLEEMYVDE